MAIYINVSSGYSIYHYQELLTGKPPFSEIEKDTAVIIALGKGKRPCCPKAVLDQYSQGAFFWRILEQCWGQTAADRPTATQIEALVCPQ